MTLDPTGWARRHGIAPPHFVLASFLGCSIGLLAFLTGTVAPHVTGSAAVATIGASAAPSLSRAELLAFMWGAPFTAPGIISGAICLLFLALAGALGSLLLQRPLGAAASSFALCAGLAGGWSLLTPPLQAPDEIDHFLGFFEVKAFEATARPDVLAWANRMHFERIKFRRQEGFNGAHVVEPLSGQWGSHIAPVDVQARAPLTFRVWNALAGQFSQSGFAAGTWLLILRFANALALSAAFAIASLAIASVSKKQPAGEASGASAAFVATVLLIPTFCFFAAYASNYGSVTMGLVVFFAGLHMSVQGDARRALDEAAIGLLIGAGLAAAMVATRSTGSIAALLAFLLLSRNLFERLPLERSAAFWLATGVSFFAVMQLPDTHYQESMVLSIRDVFARVGVAGLAPSLTQAQGFLASLFVVLLLVEVAIQRSLSKFSPHRQIEWNQRAAYVLAAAIATCILVAANISPGPLANNEIKTPLLGLDYVRPVIIRFLDQVFPISAPDFFLSTSFWGGFGWLDRLLPGPLMFVLKMVPLAALITFGVAAIRGTGARTAWLKMSVYFFAAIFLVAVNAYLTTRLEETINIHGRYLIVAYLLFLLPAMGVMRNAFHDHASVRGAAIASLLVMHTGLWCWLLDGYLF